MAAKALSIDRVGAPSDGKIREDVIYRLKKAPQSPIKYPYLVVSENADGLADVLTVNNFRGIKEKLKNRVKRGTGLEVTVAPARKMEAAGVGRWFESIKELYSFCHSSGCQFILSSGANSMHEMVSAPCLDAILKNCDVDPQSHWQAMNIWLETKLSKRVSI